MSRTQQRYILLVVIFLIACPFWFYNQSVLSHLKIPTGVTVDQLGLAKTPVANVNNELVKQNPIPAGTHNAVGTQQNGQPKTEQQIAEEEALAAALAALEPCTVVNPLSHRFIDLSSLSARGNEGKPLYWNAKGFDLGLNFTLGICSTPLKQSALSNEISDISNSSEVGAFYIEPETGRYVSIGQYSDEPVFRGKKLTLTYKDGSYCPGLVDSISGERVRKSTILSFTCDREMLAKASISYIGSANDCTYFFEVRSHYACPTAAKADNLAVIWIFLIILLAALGVYGSGGLLYKHMKRQKNTEKN